jgi:hypothetical protein
VRNRSHGQTSMIRPLSIVRCAHPGEPAQIGVVFSVVPADSVIKSPWYGVAFPDQHGHLEAIRSFSSSDIVHASHNETSDANVLMLRDNLRWALFQLDLEQPI